MDKFFLHQIKHNKTTDTFDKGIVVKDTLEAAKQSFHAYLGAYAYHQNDSTDYVAVHITNSNGNCVIREVWTEENPTAPEDISI